MLKSKANVGKTGPAMHASEMGAQLRSMENLLAKVGDKRVRSSNYLLPNVGIGGAPLPLRWCTPHTGAA